MQLTLQMLKNAVSDVTLRLDTNSKTGSVKFSEGPLKVIGANGIRTDLVGIRIMVVLLLV